MTVGFGNPWCYDSGFRCSATAKHVYSKLRQSAHGVPPWIQECMLSRFHVLESVSLQTFPCNLLAHDTKMDEIDAVV